MITVKIACEVQEFRELLGLMPGLAAVASFEPAASPAGPGIGFDRDIHAAAEASAGPLGIGRRIFNGPFARKRAELVEGLVANGIDRGTAEEAIGELGDGTLLRLLIQYGPQILSAILKLLALIP